MGTSRRQLVTGLFVVASLCLDVVFLSLADVEAPMVAMLFGQSFAAGGWLVLGRAHRLTRGAAFVAANLWLAMLATLRFYEAPNYPQAEAWSSSLTSVAVLSGAAAAATFGWLYLLRWSWPRPSSAPAGKRWQFPLAELFGWTIVVAVASAALRFAKFAELGNQVGELIAMLLFSAVAALLMAMFLGTARRRGPASAIVAAAAVAALFTLAPRFVPSINGEILSIIAGAYVFVAAFIVVQRIDGSQSPPHHAAQNATPLTESTVEDERPSAE